jgi:acetyl-CoA carboxylase biotin carboxyl carrier protein
LPWFAALFLRAFFLRDFFAMRTKIRARRTSWTPGVPSRSLRLATTYEERTTMAEEIRAEMVANVWKVVKATGDEVAEGDTLVILESMKMEIPVVAESDGTVTQIAVNEGDVVQEGDLIAVVD